MCIKTLLICLAMTVLFSFCALMFALAGIPQNGECLVTDQEALFRVNKQQYLANPVIETKQAPSETECIFHCVGEESCTSVNYKTSGIGKGRCELNSKPGLQETSEMAKGLTVMSTITFKNFKKIILQFRDVLACLPRIFMC